MKAVQKKYLRGLCHLLKPLILIGNKGLSDSVMAEIAAALEHHELIKVKLGGGDRGEKKAMVEKISTQLAAEIVQTIGHVACFYKHNPDKQVIVMPEQQ